jgi:hypothetical protein
MMIQKSLCDLCQLNKICAIRVLESEVGTPSSGYGSKPRNRVLSCKYYTMYDDKNQLKDELFSEIIAMFRKKYPFLEQEECEIALRNIIYRER